MTQLSLIVNSMPRDLTEFVFFLAVGFTAGSMGLIWAEQIFLNNISHNYEWLNKIFFKILKLKVLFLQENQISIFH